MNHNIALIGLGKISEAHIAGWKAARNANLEIVVDTDPNRAEKIARDHHIPEFESDFQKVLDRSDIDIVDLAVPHYLHAPYTIAALKAGKDVLVEKPIATRLADATQMVETADRTKRKLMVAEPIRFSASHRRAANMITEGKIGNPYLFTTRVQYYVPLHRLQGINTGWRSEAEKIGGGVLLESGIHNVATATYLMGDVESVSAFRGKQVRPEIVVEDTISVLLRFTSGAIGQGNFSWAARWSEYTDEFTVFGTEGVIGNNIRNGRIFLDDGAGQYREWAETSGDPGKTELIRHFLDCVDNDRTPVTSGVEELKNLKVVIAAYRSSVEGRVVSVNEL